MRHRWPFRPTLGSLRVRHRRPLRSTLTEFCRARDGMIATEFALVLPFMIALYFGVLTFSDGFAVKQRLQSLSRTAADLVGRIPPSSIGAPPSVNAAEITNVAKAAAAVLAPYDPAGATITLASVVVRLNGTKLEGRVCWSAARRIQDRSTITETTVPPRLAKDAIVSVPPGFRSPGMTYLVSDVEHVYRPVVGDAITGNVTLSDVVPWPVRAGQQVVWQGQSPCPLS